MTEPRTPPAQACPVAPTPCLGSASEFVRIPPGRRYVWVPLDSRQATLSGLSLYNATRRRGRLGSGLASLTVRLIGPRAFPLLRERWVAPIPEGAWNVLSQQWAQLLPDHDGIAVHERPQGSRSGFAVLLLAAGRPVAFIKVRQGEASLLSERRVLDALAEAHRHDVRTPRVLAAGAGLGCSWLALEPIPGRGRNPRCPLDVDALLSALADGLQAGLRDSEALDDHPAHWEPMHGDLTAWNVRHDKQGRLWVFDWEDTGWGPPGADETYYRATSAAIFGTPAGTSTDEAVDWWLTTVRSRSPEDNDAPFNVRLAEILEGMRPSSAGGA